MIEKRYKVHNMIKGMNVGESVDLELMKELIEKYGPYEYVDILITNNGKEMTYKETVDLLNENEQLKTQIKIFEMFLKENNLDIDWISFCGLDHLCIANDNDFECQYCPCLEFRGCFDD